MNNLPNILICGKMASGKTSLRTLIMSIYPQYEHRAFGDKVKDIAHDLFSMDKDKSKKDRDLLVGIGTKMREINPDVWANYVRNSIKPNDNIIIDDLRYKNELKVIQKLPKPWFIIKIRISPELQLKRLKKTYPKTWKTHMGNIKHHSEIEEFDDLKGDFYFQYQSWQNLLLEIALSPTKIKDTEIFSDNELDVLKCLQHLISEGIKIKILNHDGANLELNKVIEKSSFNHLFKLLDDTNQAISLSQTTVNMKLLLDNVLVVWSHITNLKKYPAITNFQEH